MLLGLILSACVAAPQTGAPARPKGQTEIAFDRAIADLPKVGCEGYWSMSGGYGLRRSALDLRELLSRGLRMSDEQWARALENSGVLRTRDKWPAGVPIAVSMNAPAWLHPVAMHAVPRDLRLMSVEAGDLAHLHCGYRIEKACAEKQRKAEYQEIGTLGIGKHHIVFDVTVEEGSDDDGTSFGSSYVRAPRPKQPPGTVLWAGPLAIDVEVVPTLEDAMPSRESDSLSYLVRRSLRRAPTAAERGSEGDVGIYLETGLNLIENCALSLEFELYRGGVPLARGSTLAATIPGYNGCFGMGIGRSTDVVDLGRVDPALLTVKPPEELELRVRGVAKDVLRDFDADIWWSGTISIALSSLPAPE